jgi:hypothetical protein
MAKVVLKSTADDIVISEHDAASDATSGVYIDGTQVVGPQGAAISNVTPAADGTAVGTAFNTLLARLRAHGLIAT